MDFTTIIIALVLMTLFGGITGVIAGQLLYALIVIAAVLFVLGLLGIVA